MGPSLVPRGTPVLILAHSETDPPSLTRYFFARTENYMCMVV